MTTKLYIPTNRILYHLLVHRLRYRGRGL